MKAVENIREQIRRTPLGKPIAASSLKGIASNSNIRQTLSRMVKAGEIERVTRGIFVRPKKIAYLGKVLPQPREIAKIIAKTSGETIAPHGAEAARILQLSTQVPMQHIFYTTGNTRRIKMDNVEIIFKHISSKKLVEPNTIVGLVISALWYLGKAHISEVVIKKIKQQLEPEQFARLFKYTQKMPAWMADAFYHYQLRHPYAG